LFKALEREKPGKKRKKTIAKSGATEKSADLALKKP